MSTWKAASSQTTRRASAASHHAVTTKRPPAPVVGVLSLALDPEEDPGGDPYNHTGSFCRPAIDEHSD